MKEKNCLHCFKIYKTNDKRSRFCDRDCYRASLKGKMPKNHANNLLKALEWHKQNPDKHGRLGKTLTEEQRTALSVAHLGKIAWNKGMKGFLSGEKHYNWQGGKTSKNALIRNSLEAKKFRKNVLERDNYTCQICFTQGGLLHVDHIKPFSTHPELRFDESNGRVLCVPCHKLTDTYMWRSAPQVLNKRKQYAV